MKSDIHIQIVNYNTKQYLVPCIEGLLNDLTGTDIKFKISVLDNNSSDDLSDLEDKYFKHGINFYKSEKNVGFGAGHNVLSKKEESDFLLLVNPDIKFIEQNTVKRLYDFIRTNNQTKVTGPKMITDNLVEKVHDHGEIHGLRAWVSFNLGNPYWKETSKITDSAWICGAFFLVERLAFDQVNGFDENFFLFVEEEDLCFRIRKNKGKIVYNPYITILHHSSVVAKKSDHYDASHKYYIKKHFENKINYKILNNIRSLYRKFLKNVY